jgi:ligand-binding sensor domain-containing protein
MEMHDKISRKKLKRAWLCVLAVLWLSFPSNQLYGQSKLALGGWQVHVPYQRAKAVADAGEYIYVAAESGLFYYDKEFNTTETITKVDGLREQQISAIGYDAATGTLVIAYANTQIDLLRGNTLHNISDVFRKTIAGEKKINHVFIHNKLAYLSSTFGVVVLDLQKLEVKDTYSNLGPAGEMVSVQSTAILRDSIYIATNLGLLAARQDGVNLQDFRNWSILNVPAADAATALVAFHNRLYAATSSGSLYILRNGGWNPASIVTDTAIHNLSATNTHMAVVTAAGIILVDQQGESTQLAHQFLGQPQDAVVGSDGLVWAADGANGLVRLDMNGIDAAAFVPNGPYSNNSFRVYARGGKVYVLSGGYDQNYIQAGIQDGFYTYKNGEWSSFNQFLYPDPQGYVPARDLVSAVYNPVTDKMYFGSYGNGLLVWGGLGDALLYNNTNSTLLSSLAPEDRQAIYVTDMAVDTEGNVWVVNRNQLTNAPGLHMLQPDGAWKSFVLPGVADSSNLEHILIDDFGQKWLSVARRRNTGSGLVVFDDAGNLVRQLTAGEGKGGLPDGAVYSMAKDLNGDIWIGTGSGVGVYYNPAFLFETQPYDAHLPIIDKRPLLNGQVVRAIAVDGANRKWMGTDNGLWLFSPDGDELLHHFTTRNSPLPSDKVLSVAVEHQTGEVFVATEAGVASYRAGATITEGKPECSTVYPNPVRRDYTGLIGVSGLPNNADVRITDISGTLVYKTRATGGTLAWDARDYNGKRVKAGVYLVLSSDAEGSQTCISKIAVLE